MIVSVSEWMNETVPPQNWGALMSLHTAFDLAD